MPDQLKELHKLKIKLTHNKNGLKHFEDKVLIERARREAEIIHTQTRIKLLELESKTDAQG